MSVYIEKDGKRWQIKLGADLKVGDHIRTWWQPGCDKITALAPYTGTYKNDILQGARLASFALNKTGMTIEAWMLFHVLADANE